MFQLRVKPDEGHPFATAVGKDVFLIGRGEACDLILQDLLVSREHARLVLGPDGPLLEDLNSINGTFVNGRRIGRIRLRDGDVIRLGGIEITLEPLLEQTVVQAPSPPPGPETAVPGDPNPISGSPVNPGTRLPRSLDGENSLTVILSPSSDNVPDRQIATTGWRLQVTPAEAPPFTFPLKQDRIRLGRSEKCDLVLADPGVSREHALLLRTPTGWEIEDLGSGNGTYWNQKKISFRQPLRPGDQIRLGRSALLVEQEGGQLSSSAVPQAPDEAQAKIPDLEDFADLLAGPSPLHLLVVHPDSAAIAALLLPLKQGGAVIHDAARTATALAFVRETPPDLILLSPDVAQSWDLCRDLGSDPAPVPILVMMEDHEWEEILPFIKAGAADVLVRNDPYELLVKIQKLVERHRLRRGGGKPEPPGIEAAAPGKKPAEPPAPTEKPSAPESPALSSEVKKDFFLLIASRVCTRLGDGFLRIISILLVAGKTKDPMLAGLVLVFRYLCEILINAISGPFIDKIRIRNSLMAADLIRCVLSLLLIAAVLLDYSYVVILALSFLGDFIFIFFKPAADKMIKVTFPVKEGTKVLSRVDAANHASNIGGYALASFLAGWLGASLAVFLAPVFFFLAFLLAARLHLSGEKVIDYAKVRKKSYWASQREGLGYTWNNPPLRFLLLGRSLVAVGRGAFTVLSVVYLANLAKGLSAYGYFESAQSIGKVLVTALVIPFFFAYRSTFFLTSASLVIIGLSFFGFNLADDVLLACLVGSLVGAGQAAEAVGIDAIINRYSEAHIQGRAKSTTSFGSRVFGLAAIGTVYLLVNSFHFSARTLFGWLGIFPLLGALVFFWGWIAEKKEALTQNPST